MRLSKKFLSILVITSLLLLTLPSSGFTGEEKADTKKAPSRTPDGFYIMKGRDDVQRFASE